MGEIFTSFKVNICKRGKSSIGSSDWLVCYLQPRSSCFHLCPCLSAAFHCECKRKQETMWTLHFSATFIFCKYTRNVYKRTVETSVQCKLSKLKRDITLKSFCTQHDKGIVIFSSKTKLVYLKRKCLLVTSEHRDWEIWVCYTEEQIKERKKKDGMAQVLIPEGGRHSSRQITQHQCFTLLSHQDNQPSSKSPQFDRNGAFGSTYTLNH